MNHSTEDRVLLLAPTRQDAALSQSILARADLPVHVCAHIGALHGELAAGAGAILVTEEILGADGRDRLVAVLHAQPEWSDVPILLLCGMGIESPVALQSMEALGNVTVLDRPVRVIDLVTALRSALKARRRQYQVRDYLEAVRQAEARLKAVNATLEERVLERTAEAQERATQLSALAAELTRTENRERDRIARLLHDGLQQLLVAARMHLGGLKAESEGPTNRVLSRVQSLLDDALKQARDLSVELRPPILHESGLTAGLEWLSRRCQEQYDLTVHFHADENCDPPDPVLRDFLFQAARELLFNITKHANTNEAWVSVTCLDKDAVELEVRDAGVGCNVAEIGGPTGDHFGLFAIRERLKLLDGKLEIESGPKGTRVVLSVPIDDDRPATSGAPSEEGHIGFEAPTDDSAEHHRIRVLMADDHPLVREGILTVLQSCPEIEVVGQARDGLEATEAAISLRPDVILMDVSMPRLNGIEATRRIAEALPGARIIALSMHEGRDMARAMLAAGACAYLSKGDGADKVIAAIRAAHAT